ncbi:MAG: HutD family protein [Pikeienuella sp.]
MRIVKRPEFKTSNWKNGGGVTHEIARRDSSTGLVWRLSLADVTADGPFSSYPSMARILTVVEGKGMRLSHDGVELVAAPLKPIKFSGDLEIEGQRTGGDVQNFNLIYDPNILNAQAQVLRVGALNLLEKPAALYCCSGHFDVGDVVVPTGAVALLDDPAVIQSSGTGVLIEFTER